MFSTYRQSIRQFNRDLRLFLLTTILIGFGYMGVYQILFNLYLLRLGYGLTFIGLVNGSAQLTAFTWLPAMGDYPPGGIEKDNLG